MTGSIKGLEDSILSNNSQSISKAGRWNDEWGFFSIKILELQDQMGDTHWAWLNQLVRNASLLCRDK